MTGKEFTKDWKHFLNCIDFANSYLDAKAIRFMNEAPAKIIEALNNTAKRLSKATSKI